jgi:hypothetical protein
VNFNSHHLFLIADIDRVLALTGDPEEVSQETEKVLQKVRSFLAEYKPSSSPISPDVAQQIAQAVIGEIDVKRSQWLQPIQWEISELSKQRQEILKEVRQLEVQRQDIISEFLEILMERFHKTLETKINKTLKDATYQLLSQNGDIGNVGDIPSFADISTDYLAQLHHFQKESDQILQSLDLTFRTVFDSLKLDLHTYENALSNGLERIYTLGQQSEIAMLDYVEPISSHLPESSINEESENITNLEDLSNLDQDLDVKKNLENDHWINTIVEPSVLKEEPEIRPLLEIDLGDPKYSTDKDISKKELSSEDLFFESDKFNYSNDEVDVNEEQIIIPDLTFPHKNQGKNGETILFGETTKSVTEETPLTFSSLEEILFTQAPFIEDLNQEIPSGIMPVNHGDTSQLTAVFPEANMVKSSVTEENIPIDTIKLLTDLLEEGALDDINSEMEISGINEDDHDVLTPNENLLPNLETETIEQTNLKEQLSPDKLDKLEEDLESFGGENLSKKDNNNQNFFPSPWDDIAGVDK